MNTIHLTKAAAGKHFLLGSDVITIKSIGQETSRSMLVLEVRVPSGGGPPMLHRHAYAEAFYFLEGNFMVSTADSDLQLRTLQVHAGDTLAVPSMVWHNFKNVGDQTGRFLVVHSPAIMEGLLLELGQPIDDPLHPPLPDKPPTDNEIKSMLKVLEKYMEFLPPDTLIK